MANRRAAYAIVADLIALDLAAADKGELAFKPAVRLELERIYAAMAAAALVVDELGHALRHEAGVEPCDCPTCEQRGSTHWRAWCECGWRLQGSEAVATKEGAEAALAAHRETTP